MIFLLAELEPWYRNAWVVYPVLVAAGFIAGIVNTIAGGGSFLTLPILMYVGGLDAKIANGTNRIAILMSSGSAVAVFHKHGYVDKKSALRMLIPALVGAPAGTLLAYYLSPAAFRGAFGVLFLIMAVFICVKPSTLISPTHVPNRSRTAESLFFFAIGVYVGFIQAGMGILLLLGISLFHARELVSANGVKNAIGFVVTLMALLMFIYLDQVMWLPGLIMAIGNVVGGIVGAKLAIKKGKGLVYAFLVVVMVVTGIKLVAEAFMTHGT